MPDPFSLLAALLMHTGSKHLSINLTDAQKVVINSPFGKIATLFGMFYLSTRSVFWSIVLIMIYFLCINILLNEHHPLNIYSMSWLQQHGFRKYQDLYNDEINIYYSNLKKLTG